jgi:hypothetical protein
MKTPLAYLHACAFFVCDSRMYNRDEYVLKDGDKTACVHQTHGVIQGCFLSTLLFFPLH